jgi:uncharacterized protein
MNRKIFFTLIAVMALSVLISACGPAVAQGNEQPVRTMSVTGTSQIAMVPDIAYINIGVQTRDADAVAAVAENNRQAQQVIDALMAMGVAERDIRTSNFSIYPNQEYDRDGRVTGITYFVSNSVNVTLRDIDQIGEILNETVSVGANSINGIQFDVEDKSGAVNEARKAAISNAEATASELAQAAGVRLGEIQSLSFSGSGAPPPIIYERVGMEQPAMDMAVPVATGELTFTVEAYVVYEIH